MLLRIFATRRTTILIILSSIFLALAVALANLPRQGWQVSLDHVKEVRVIGDDDNKILKVSVDAAILDGKVYVVDSGALKVKVFSERGKELFEFQGTRWYDVKGAKLEYPSAIAVGPDDMLYVADLRGGKVVVFDKHGVAKKIIKLPKEGQRPAKPLSLAFDLIGHLYVGEGETGKIMVFANDRFLREFAVGSLDHPNGIAVDKKRRVFVADSNHERILIYDNQGRPEREWRVTDKKSFVPRGIVFDSRGRLIVADMLNSRIVFINENGRRTRQMITLPNMDQLFLPSGLFIDKEDNLTIADRGLGQVFIIKVP